MEAGMLDLPNYLETAIVKACRVPGREVLEAAVRVTFAPFREVPPINDDVFDKAHLKCVRLSMMFGKMPECGQDYMSAIHEVTDALVNEIQAREKRLE